MSKTKIYSNNKIAKAIRESYDALLKEWNCTINEFDINGRYGSTHVLEVGSPENPPLVLFHGVGDDAALMWVYNARELSLHFHIYAVDTIGGPGKSEPDNGYDKSFEDEIWIDEIFDFLKIDKAYIAGVSNGGYLAQMYSIRRPERVIKGVCMAASLAVGSGDNGKNSAMKTMMKIFLPEALFPTDKNVKKLISKMTGSNYHPLTDNAIVYRHFKQLMTGFNRAAMMNHKVKAFNESEILSIKDKVLFIAGRKDPFMLLGGAALIEKYEKEHGLKAAWIDDAGHGINQERAEEVNELIINYFRAV